ncbi:DUF935 family protein [Fibrella sp. WM1]|uniref:phage portal protein family protein n=1 Tax=Fibrella musci TaxID=3242485 RepID=UPI0035218F24
MAKNRNKAKQKPAAVANTKQIVVNDFGIQLRTLDRTPKDLGRWKAALQSAESILSPNRKLLYDLYDDITLDGHLTSVMEQRRLAITTSALLFQKDGKPNEQINALINSLGFLALLGHIIDSVAYGYSLIRADFTAPRGPAVDLVPRAHVVPQFGIVVEQPGSFDGTDYTQPPYTNLYLGVGNPDDLGKLLKAAPLVLLKRGNVSDWSSFNEIFGQPHRKYTYSSIEQKAQLERMANEQGRAGYSIIPEGANMEVMGNYQTASATTYSMAIDHFDKELSKLFVGQTMTTDSGSSLSQSEVHERVGDRVGMSDRQFVILVLESLVKPMLIAQGIPADGNFQFADEEESVAWKDRLDGDLKIHKEVGPLTQEYFAEEYHVEFDKTAKKKEPGKGQQGEDDPEEEDAAEQPNKKEKPAKGKQENSAPSFEELKARATDWFRKVFGSDPFANFR